MSVSCVLTASFPLSRSSLISVIFILYRVCNILVKIRRERGGYKLFKDYFPIGDYVLTGGELPAMVMVDAISRMVPGVLTNNESGSTESFEGNLLEYPQYTPDFIKLAESYRAKGIRVTKKEEIAAAFEEAKKNTKAPTVIEFIIDPEEMVYPMIKPGGTLEDMIMDC